MRFKALILAVALLLVNAVAALAEGVEVSGQVVNGSTGEPVPGQQVELLRLGIDGSQQSLGTAVADGEGNFRLPPVNPSQDSIYRIVAQYKGVVYSSVDIVAESLSRPIEVRVYEVASDPSVIAFNRATVALMGIDRNANLLRVLELYTVRNSSKSAYVSAPGNPMGMLRFGLPPGAMELAPQMGLRVDDIIQVAQGFAVNAPVVPGDTELAFSYSVPLTDVDMTFAKVLPFPTENLRFLAKDGLATVQPEGLIDAGIVNLGGETFHMWTASSLPARYELSVELKGLPAPPKPPLESPYVRLALFGITALALAIGVVYAWKRRSPPQAQIERLFLQLSELEARRRAKVVTEEQYRERRESLRASLKAMLAHYGYRAGGDTVGSTTGGDQPA